MKLAPAVSRGVQERFWESPIEVAKKSNGGKLTLSAEGPLLCNRVVGHFDQALADQVMASGNELLSEHSSITVFADWQQMDSYDSSCRQTMTAWGVNLGKRLEAYHVVAGSRMVRMGLAVASIVVPTLRVHADVASLVSAYRDSRRQRRHG